MILRKIISRLLVWLLIQPATAQDSIPGYIITTGKLPQLAYSTGVDRLGSAKMGYIDTLVVMKVLDTIRDLYKVQLSSSRFAYLDKIFGQPYHDTTMSAALCESWKVSGNDRVDSVSISLSGRVPYKTWMEINPARIKIELYNVQSNTNWITQLSSAKAVKNVWYDQIESDVMLITIELTKQQHFGYSVGYNGKQLLLKIKRLPNATDLKKLTVAIDAGHGGTNLGASGSTGILEKDYTLLFARELQKILKKQKINTVMVRDKDTTIENKDRVLWAQQIEPDLFISFHLNSSGRPFVRGVSTYYKHIGFRSFTQSLLKRLLTIKGLQEFGNIGSFNFTPIQPTDYPSCLVEVAFLSNREDEKMIIDAKFRTRVANQVYLGIKDWVNSFR